MKVALSLLLIFAVSFTVDACPDHEIQIYNGCPFAVWPAVFSTIQPNTNNGFKLDPYQSRSIQVPCKWQAARVWARTDCDGEGRNCMTGDCGGMVCQGSGQPGKLFLIYSMRNHWVRSSNLELLLAYNCGSLSFIIKFSLSY